MTTLISSSCADEEDAVQYDKRIAVVDDGVINII
jgi:hypothetical protein